VFNSTKNRVPRTYVAGFNLIASLERRDGMDKEKEKEEREKRLEKTRKSQNSKWTTLRLSFEFLSNQHATG
jgi:hypothetical protein